MLQQFRTSLAAGLVRYSAPVVAGTFYLLATIRSRVGNNGPLAEYWPRLRAEALPILDDLARWLGLGYAAYELSPREYAGTLDLQPEAAERLLYQHGFRRNPFAAYKTLPDGRTEVGSWAFRPSLLARRQVHVMLFDRDGPGTDVYAHTEYSAINPLVAYAHYIGRGYSPAKGQARVHDLLPTDHWLAMGDPAGDASTDGQSGTGTDQR